MYMLKIEMFLKKEIWVEKKNMRTFPLMLSVFFVLFGISAFLTLNTGTAHAHAESSPHLIATVQMKVYVQVKSKVLYLSVKQLLTVALLLVSMISVMAMHYSGKRSAGRRVYHNFKLFGLLDKLVRW